jgi:hypothetical protein
MAWLFSLSAECGTKKADAEAVAGHFHGFIVVLADGSQFPCEADVGQVEGAWWAVVYPEGVCRGGVGNEKDARELTEVGFILYEQLRSAPPFRFALVGVEVYDFRKFEELNDDLVNWDFNGVVLADAIWQRLGSPTIYVPFAPGYRWRPFIQAR